MNELVLKTYIDAKMLTSLGFPIGTQIVIKER